MLFSPKDNSNMLPAQMRGAFFDDSPAVEFSLQSMKDIERNIGKLRQDFHYYFWSRGQWSMHELLQYLLNQTGPAKVFLSTWTITEEPARRLFLMKQDGLIQELHCVLDYRIKTRKPKPLQLLENTADSMKLTQCHAKSLVIINSDWAVSVIGSANLSKNPRLEAGVICTAPKITEFNLEVLRHELDS